jgi:hypothetical protein
VPGAYALPAAALLFSVSPRAAALIQARDSACCACLALLMCACVWQVLVGHPLDTIKVRIQTMEVIPGQPPPYKGMADCASQIVKKEGVCLTVPCVVCM